MDTHTAPRSKTGTKAASGSKAGLTVKRPLNGPWWARRLRESVDVERLVPDSARRWVMKAEKGNIRECTINYDFGSKTTTIRSDVGNNPVLTIEDLEKIWEYGEENGCTVVEAFISVYGEDNLAKSWIETAKKNAGVGWAKE